MLQQVLSRQRLTAPAPWFPPHPLLQPPTRKHLQEPCSLLKQKQNARSSGVVSLSRLLPKEIFKDVTASLKICIGPYAYKCLYYMHEGRRHLKHESYLPILKRKKKKIIKSEVQLCKDRGEKGKKNVFERVDWPLSFATLMFFSFHPRIINRQGKARHG